MSQPSKAFIGASWGVLVLGIVSYLIGLYNADMLLNEKGYYFTIIMYGLFAAISIQKNVRDKQDGITVSMSGKFFFFLSFTKISSF